MTAVYRSLPASEVQRIERIEFLDETELLDQLLDHASSLVFRLDCLLFDAKGRQKPLFEPLVTNSPQWNLM